MLHPQHNSDAAHHPAWCGMDCLESRVHLSSSATYSLTDLGYLGTGPDARPYAITAGGLIAGTKDTGRTDTHGNPIYSAFLYSPRRGMLNLGVLRGMIGAEAFDVNDSGEVVGACQTGRVDNGNTEITVPFTWTPTQGMKLLPMFRGAIGGKALAVNNAGQVVGSDEFFDREDTYYYDHAFVYSPGKALLDPTPLAMNSVAHDINNLGQVVGEMDGAGATTGFLYVPGHRVTALPKLPGGAGLASNARVFNDIGQIVGDCYTSSYSGDDDVLFSRPRRDLINLTSIAGFDPDSALGLNIAGQVVGTAFDFDTHAKYAAIYTVAAGVIDLNTALAGSYGWSLKSATAINASGSIVGMGINTHGVAEAFILTPVR